MKKIELMAPGGDLDSILAAIIAGADAVYCGLDRFNARNRASNLSYDQLLQVIRFAHSRNCQIFLTLNIIIYDSEFPSLVNLLNKLVNSGIDAVIVQDLGVFALLKEKFPSLNVHASTQNTIHNRGQISFLRELGATRVNLSRECSFQEITSLTTYAHEQQVETELFVHGSHCIGFSGICHFSETIRATSGNRGRCSQPCRDSFMTTEAGKNYPFNLKDNSSYSEIELIAKSGVDSLKIEGRIKKYNYVYSVVSEWRKQIDRVLHGETIFAESENLRRVFNRGFSTAFFHNRIGESLFTENPKDDSANQIEGESAAAKRAIYDHRTAVIDVVQEKIRAVDLAFPVVTLAFSGAEGKPFVIDVSVENRTARFCSASILTLAYPKRSLITPELIDKNFRSLGEQGSALEFVVPMEQLKGLSVVRRELTAMKREIFSFLNESRTYVKPVEYEKLSRAKPVERSPQLIVLISNPDDLALTVPAGTIRAFAIAEECRHSLAEYQMLFARNPDLTPWFPAILFDADLECAITLLNSIAPRLVITDCTALIKECVSRSIPWIAGPLINAANSHTIKLLHDSYGCVGAFPAVELTDQLNYLVLPDEFLLCDLRYGPRYLFTSRACLFQTVTGCPKSVMDETCLESCVKRAYLTTSEGEPLVVSKEEGSNNAVYHRDVIVHERNGSFDRVLIDLRDIVEEKRFEEKQFILDRYC